MGGQRQERNTPDGLAGEGSLNPPPAENSWVSADALAEIAATATNQAEEQAEILSRPRGPDIGAPPV